MALLSATYYECIFKLEAPNKKTGTFNFPAVYSTDDIPPCESYCPPISKCSEHNNNDIQVSNTSPKDEDPLENIQLSCTGHRLAVLNGRNYLYPTIINNEYIFAEQYNALKDIIEQEINTRKLSKKYNDLSTVSIPELTAESKSHIFDEQLIELNNLIVEQKLYHDVATKPTLTIDNQTIHSIDINKSITALRSLANDCVCYSDCNGYSVCWCYGNCNHY